MPAVANLEEHAIWKREQAGYAVTIHPSHSYHVTAPSGHTIATPTSLAELRALADQLDELVWVGLLRACRRNPALPRRGSLGVGATLVAVNAMLML